MRVCKHSSDQMSRCFAVCRVGTCLFTGGLGIKINGMSLPNQLTSKWVLSLQTFVECWTKKLDRGKIGKRICILHCRPLGGFPQASSCLNKRNINYKPVYQNLVNGERNYATGLSLRAGGLGFSPANKRVAPGYFYWKIEQNWNQKKSLAVWFPAYLLYLPGNLKS